MEHSLELFYEAVFGISVAMIISSGVYLLAKRVKFLPYSAWLVVLGLVLSRLGVPWLESVRLSPGSLFFIFLPILLYESSVNFNIRQFRTILTPSLLFATVGLLISSLVVGFGVHLVLGIKILESMLFGVIISSTDPIAVLSIFKKIGVSKRLSFLIDAESILNDAASVIVFRIILGAIAGGALTVNLVGFGLLNFGYVLVSSVGFGAFMGYLFAKWISSVQSEKPVEISLTIVLAILTFAVSEHVLHSSGIIAVLVAGLIMGNYGNTKISPKVQKTMYEIWEFLGFVAVSLVFLMVGFEVSIDDLVNHAAEIVIMVILVLLGRSIAIYGIGSVFNKSQKEEHNKIPLKWLHIANLGGLRGSLPLIMVLLIPEDFPLKEEFITFVLGVVLFTLVVNTSLVPSIVSFFGVNKKTELEELEYKTIRILILNKVLDKLDYLKQLDEIRQDMYKNKVEEIKEEINFLKIQVGRKLNSEKESKSSELFEKVLRRYCLNLEGRFYKDLYHKEVIPETVFIELKRDIDIQKDLVSSSIDQYNKNLKGHMKHKYSLVPGFLSFLIRSHRGEETFEYVYHKTRKVGDEIVLLEIERIMKENLLPKIDVIKKIESEYKHHLRSNQKETEEYYSMNLIEHKKLERKITLHEYDFIHESVENLFMSD